VKRTFSAFIVASVIVIALTGCKHDGAPGSGPSAFYDTTETVKTEPATGQESIIFFQPKQGDVFRYRVTNSSNASAENTDNMFNRFLPKSDVTSKTVYYLQHIVEGVRPDSSVKLSIRFDSIAVDYRQDTSHVSFTSTRESDKKDPRFSNAATLAGQEVGAIVTRTGDVIEIYGISNIVSKFLQQLPDSLRTVKAQEDITANVKKSLNDYLVRTLTHFPGTRLSKDSTWGSTFTQNSVVWNNVLYPMQIDSRERLAGYEERSGKRLAVFEATSTLKPVISTQEQPPLRLMLDKWQMSSNVTSKVDEKNGALVYREFKQSKDFIFAIENQKEKDKTFRTVQSYLDHTVVELLK
jgi:hypothetical protein